MKKKDRLIIYALALVGAMLVFSASSAPTPWLAGIAFLFGAAMTYWLFSGKGRIG